MKQLAAGGAKHQLVFSYNIELEEENSLIYFRIRWRKIESSFYTFVPMGHGTRIS